MNYQNKKSHYPMVFYLSHLTTNKKDRRLSRLWIQYGHLPYCNQPYKKNEEQSNTFVPKISFTQQITDQKVDTPDIYISDPINVNPNSIANIEKILLHIEKISGIRNGTSKWVVVTCDGIPYCFAIKLKEKFPWLILVPGQLHEEMNMLHAFVELNC
ncbi:hypothetical protein C2G38_2257392 [Gigaspora rosea]|uniref:Uncharacterized protein n=1 Tax=Gigaspora rosea TaxID=44941 RepID=A0A397US93_9GLOM|nr:hypothetical protein C2G38_2257392 [Gigaspora rosea]